MKLFVDDLRKAPDGWELARTNTDAIQFLATGEVDEISLDHDILHKIADHITGYYIGAETFKPVAYYLSLMLVKPKISFHTANITAGEVMAKIIGCQFNHWWHEQP